MTNKLSVVKSRKKVVIDSITASESQREQFLSLGFIPGTEMTVVSKAPFSGPIAIELRGTKVAIRKKDADCILVHI